MIAIHRVCLCHVVTMTYAVPNVTHRRLKGVLDLRRDIGTMLPPFENC